MPGSSDLLDDVLIQYLRQYKGALFDIGPGMGKIGKLGKEAGCDPVSCLECHEPYVSQFDLRSIYDVVEVGFASDLFKFPDRVFGIVTLGDVIEHMPKSSGRDLLEFLVIRSSLILVKFPVHDQTSSLFQGASHGNQHEAHVSIWSESDFRDLDAMHHRNGPMRLAIIRGYRPPA